MMREKFSNSLGRPILSREDEDAHQAAKGAWMGRWVSRYGDSAGVWIEISETKVNPVQNPTGHAVSCWSAFDSEFNGVYRFVPFTAAINERFEPMVVVV